MFKKLGITILLTSIIGVLCSCSGNYNIVKEFNSFFETEDGFNIAETASFRVNQQSSAFICNNKDVKNVILESFGNLNYDKITFDNIPAYIYDGSQYIRYIGSGKGNLTTGSIGWSINFNLNEIYIRFQKGNIDNPIDAWYRSKVSDEVGDQIYKDISTTFAYYSIWK